MTHRILLPALAAVLTAALPVAADAAVIVRTGDLSGAQEVPAVNSPGSGTTIVSFDTQTNLLAIEVLWINLLGGTTVAHIHCCTGPGANAGVATPTPSFPGFPTGATSGSYRATFDLTQASSFNPAFVSANGGTVDAARAVFVSNFDAGRTYFNLHTSRFPSGELRAQLVAPVPEPSTWALMLLGFGAIGAGLRAHRRSYRATARLGQIA